MAYQTGTVADLQALKTVIETFCTTNGWTKSGNVVHKGSVYWELVYSTSTQNHLQFSCGDGIDGGNLLTTKKRVGSLWEQNFNISVGNPFTYHLFLTTDQNNFFCIINYATDYIKHLCFGTLVKYGTWVGGEYYSIFEPGSTITAGTSTNQAFDFASTTNPPVFRLQGEWNPCPFFPSPKNASSSAGGSVLRCDLDGWTFRANNEFFNTAGNDEEVVSAHVVSYRQIHAAFNAWSQTAQLVPWYITAFRGSFDLSILGVIDQIRVIRINNYNIADIITLGSDQWMIFPFYKKSLINPNGQSYLSGTPHSGTLGYAIRYQV